MDDLDTSGIDPELLNDPVFQRVLKEGLAIQDRFSAEPVYAKTGKGYLKSVGVEEIKAAKEEARVKEGRTLVESDEDASGE
ncbi:MAG: hypothetical protein AAGD22_10515 [Verrucomicrobiota bacterium]